MIKIEELVEQAKNGSKEAYSELIVIIQDYLYKFARTRLDNEEDIEDVIQNTIFIAYLNIRKLRNNRRFKTWITRILINECNKIYKYSKKYANILEKYSNTTVSKEYINKAVDFDDIIEILDERKKEIFELYYKKNLSIKEISEKLNVSENTIKSSLSRGKQKIKEKFKQTSIILLILCLFVTTSVIAISIINYIKSLFETNSVGVENYGTLMAIEDLDWYQQVDMSYIDLGKGYKIKLEYILMDEMNLYLVFDFESAEDISRYRNISLTDLKITNENDDVICDRGNILSTQTQKFIGDKIIEKNNYNMKSLVYMYTYSFPTSEKLNISFSKISLYTKNTQDLIKANTDFQVELSEKFINRRYTLYTSNQDKIKKAIITTTGFYAIIETDSLRKMKTIELIDEADNIYECYTHTLSNYNDSNTFEYIVMSNFNNIENKKLKLMISNDEYELIKHD